MTCRFRDRHRRPTRGWYVQASFHRTERRIPQMDGYSQLIFGRI